MNGSYVLTLDNTKRYNKPSLFMKWPGHQLVIKSAKYTLSTRQYRPCTKKRPPNFLHFHTLLQLLLFKNTFHHIFMFSMQWRSLFHTHTYTSTHTHTHTACVTVSEHTKYKAGRVCGAGIWYFSPSFTRHYFANGFQNNDYINQNSIYSPTLVLISPTLIKLLFCLLPASCCLSLCWVKRTQLTACSGLCFAMRGLWKGNTKRQGSGAGFPVPASRQTCSWNSGVYPSVQLILTVQANDDCVIFSSLNMDKLHQSCHDALGHEN